MSSDPILDLEGSLVVAHMSDGEAIKGKLVSYRGGWLTIEAKYPRPRRVVVNGFELRSIERWHRPRGTGADRRRSGLFWK